MTTPKAEPNWYPDPEMRNTLRYWDGEQWTEHRQLAPVPQQRPTPVWRIAVGVAAALVMVVIVLAYLGGGYRNY